MRQLKVAMMLLIANDEPMGPEWLDHPLTGDWADHRDREGHLINCSQVLFNRQWIAAIDRGFNLFCQLLHLSEFGAVYAL